jgi:hypothetical protein
MVFPVIGGDGKPTGYDIDNSLRFNDGDSPQLNRSFTADPDTRKKFTISFWTKRGELGSDNAVFGARTTANFWSRLHFDSSDRIRLQNVASGSTDVEFEASPRLRDPSAWYHIVFAIDTSQGAIADGVKLYINGTRITDTSSTNYTQNATFEFGRSGTTNYIGHDNENSSYFDGYISEFYYVDNQQLAPTAFGETNDNGVWIPIDAKDDITFGANGFYLEFKQTGTSQNSSGIGADTSGNDEHFAVSNLGARNVVQDTPTNNFMTWNPLFTNSRGTFAEGNCQVTTNVQGSVPYGQVEFGNFHVNSGKWYWEVEVVEVGSGGSLGLGANERAYEGTYINGHNNGGSAGNIRYNHSNGNVNNGSSTAVSGAATYTDDDTIGFAMDLDNNKMYIHKNGTYINSGDPAAGSNGITMTSSYSDYWTPWISKDDTSNNAKVYLNTGNPVLANDSGNADDNGYGDFEYDVPAGFYSLCTKNLATYG